VTAWPVQCGYAAYYANTVTVEADTPDAALDLAIETANDNPCWRSLDDCGPTFIDAVAEGADADPWQGFVSAVLVPTRFTEGGAPPLITVTVSGGGVQAVTIVNGPARVIARDCDIDGADPATLDLDENGIRCVRADWSTELPPKGG
jgi:hypothetical protein